VKITAQVGGTAWRILGTTPDIYIGQQFIIQQPVYQLWRLVIGHRNIPPHFTSESPLRRLRRQKYGTESDARTCIIESHVL